jgi:hypothetical protein
MVNFADKAKAWAIVLRHKDTVVLCTLQTHLPEHRTPNTLVRPPLFASESLTYLRLLEIHYPAHRTVHALEALVQPLLDEDCL